MFLPVYADLSSDFRVEIREEVRARMVQTTGVLVAPLSKEATFSPTAKARQLVIDSELQPLLKYRTSNARTVFSLQYNPRLVLTNLAAKDEPYALVYTGDRLPSDVRHLDTQHQAVLQFERQVGPRTRAAVLVSGLYGSASANTLVLQPPWDGQGLPGVPRAYPLIPQIRLDVIGGYANASVLHAFSPRTSLQVQAVAMSYGTPTSEGRQYFPTSRNAGLAFTLTRALSPRDTFEVTATPEVNQTQPIGGTHPDAYVGTAWGRYKRKLTERSRVELAGGASVVGLGAFGSGAQPAILYPGGELALVHNSMRGPVHTEVAFVSRLAPWVNPFAGSLVQRSETIFAARHGNAQFGLRAQGSFARAFAPLVQSADANPVSYRQAYRMVAGELAAEARVATSVWLEAGTRLNWQTTVAQFPSLPGDLLQLGGFVAASYRPKPAPQQ